jgi:hypothetical protein
MSIVNPRRLPYRDLTRHYPTPATGDPASAGWWRQAASNYSIMANAAQLNTRSGGSLAGFVPFAASWEGVTLNDVTDNPAGYVQVGQICYLWATATITALSSTPAGLANLPVPPSDSVLSMHAGFGYLYDGTSARLPFVAEIGADGGLEFWYSYPATSGQVIDADPSSISGIGEIGVYATYRVDPPAAGTLNGFGYVVQSVEPA